ncbi:hypothetical protein PSHT_02866, partial [Puccinia striiformis]
SSVTEHLQIPQLSGSSRHKPIRQLLLHSHPHSSLNTIKIFKLCTAVKRVAVHTIWIELWTKVLVSFGNSFSYLRLYSINEGKHPATQMTGNPRSRCGTWSNSTWYVAFVMCLPAIAPMLVSLAPMYTLTYPLIPCKLLVRLEHLSDHDCTSLQDETCTIMGHTTVHQVHKWILLVGMEKLEFHLCDNPSLTLIEAQKMYFKEWLDKKNASGKDRNHPREKEKGQGVEVDIQKKQKVDHSKGLLDVQLTEDSDVEIVGN